MRRRYIFFICSVFLVNIWAQNPKITIAVGDFKSNGIPASDVDILVDRLRNELMNTDKFRVMERSQMNEILSELTFQQTGMCNASQCQVQIGQMLGVEQMIVGNVGLLGGDVYTISARIIDVETGEVISTVSVDYQGRISGVLSVAIPNVALRLSGKENSTSKNIAQYNDLANGSFVDARDENTYRVVTIGTQLWMAENLKYRIGNSWCYDNNSQNCNTDGRLYDWETALSACPSGWHLPSREEWAILIDFVGGEKNAGTKLKAKSRWYDDGNGTDDVGFSVIPSGLFMYFPNTGQSWFLRIEKSSSFWSSTKIFKPDPSLVEAYSQGVEFDGTAIKSSGSFITFGRSVRCLKDSD